MRRISRQGWRQLSVLLIVLFAFSILAHSLFALQALGQAGGQVNLASLYAQDVAAPQTQAPVRGIIVDTNGKPLIGTVTVYKLAAWPSYVQDPKKTARLLTPILFPKDQPSIAAHNKKIRADFRKHYNAILKQLSRSVSYICLAGTDSPSCPAKTELSEDAKNRIQRLKVAGLTLEPRSRPSYPNGSLAAHLLGYVAYQYVNGQVVDTGQYGLERYYDSLLRGVPGHLSVRTDTSGNAIRVGVGGDAAAQQGASLTLTLDSYIQLFVEQELRRVVAAYHAAGGTIIVERPDGAILAMASSPAYDPRRWQATFKQFSSSRFIDPAISQWYEPGSTFKAFTVAMGLDHGSFNQYTPVYDNGTFKTDGITVRNWCLDYCTFGGSETVRTMLQYSSNIGAAKFSQYIPHTAFYQYLDRFGFGQPTGVDLANEIGGHFVRPTDNAPLRLWVPAYKDTIAYGQGIALTPLELVNAYTSLANGGRLMRPRLVQSYTLNGKTYTVPPQVIDQAISPETANLMRQILVDSAVGGEACKALVPNYDIAAKTGTASIPLYGTYATHETIASTAAFAPAFNPQFVVLAVVRKPDVQWGSIVAAPVIHNLMQHLFNYYHIPPDPNAEQPGYVCAKPGST